MGESVFPPPKKKHLWRVFRLKWTLILFFLGKEKNGERKREREREKKNERKSGFMKIRKEKGEGGGGGGRESAGSTYI